VTVKEVEQSKWPAKNTEDRARLITVLKGCGLWDRVADLDLHALTQILENGEDFSAANRDTVAAFQTKEKSYRLTISRKKEKASD